MTSALHRTMLFATRSEDKVRELVPIMHALGFHVTSLRAAGIAEHADEEHIEAFDTFEANALAKAHWFYRLSGGMPVLADDSGLEVHALGARPGVRSKRWSERTDLSGHALDAANNLHLLNALRLLCDSEGAAEREAGNRGPLLSNAFPFAAQYVCAAACVWSGGELVVRGVTTGSIVEESRGVGGFGYDPYFYSPELGLTFGEADREAKGLISHRGRAFRLLVEKLSLTGVFGRAGG